jgi:hypothetical protein
MAFMKRAFILAVLVSGIGLPAYGNLLIDGSFEEGNFQPNYRDAMLLSAGATDIDGWTVTNGGLSWDGPSNPFGLTASDGSYFLDLTGDYDHRPYGGVAQTISTTIGAQYRLSFDIGTDPTYDPASVSVNVTGGVGPALFTSAPSSPNRWESFTFDFTATSASTTIELDGEASTDLLYIGLDNVGLEAIPEPSTLTLVVGPGLLVFAAWRRFRKV